MEVVTVSRHFVQVPTSRRERIPSSRNSLALPEDGSRSSRGCLPLKVERILHFTVSRPHSWKIRSSVVDGSSEVTKLVPPGSVSVVLLAGGVGKRMGANMPKQYLPLLGQPIALYSFFTFSEMEEVGEIIIVCDPSYRDLFSEAIEKVGVPVKFALPGKERQDSVFSGLQKVSPSARLAAIHDSARPLVTKEDTLKVFQDAILNGAAVLGVPSKATIKEAGEDLFVTKTLDRKLLWEMQTPQVIEPGLLRQGFDYVTREKLEVTDDVSIVEYLKHPVKITAGSYTNLKVTTPEDLLLAERILNETVANVAVKVSA